MALAQKLQRDRMRNSKYQRLRAPDGARSLHSGRDDGKGRLSLLLFARHNTRMKSRRRYKPANYY